MFHRDPAPDRNLLGREYSIDVSTGVAFGLIKPTLLDLVHVWLQVAAMLMGLEYDIQILQGYLGIACSYPSMIEMYLDYWDCRLHSSMYECIFVGLGQVVLLQLRAG
jgi:hypothetical protein